MKSTRAPGRSARTLRATWKPSMPGMTTSASRQVDGARMHLGDLHRPLTARCLEHGVTRPLEHRLEGGADAAVIVDEKDGLRHGVIVDSVAARGNPAT